MPAEGTAGLGFPGGNRAAFVKLTAPRKEAKDVSVVERELESEARDREILTAELHKLLEEIQLLRTGGPESHP